jgi:predicted PurR-regulated permease PerM
LNKEQPFYIKATVILFGLILALYSLSVLRDILVPVAFALIIAILLNPLVMKMRRGNINHIVAISLSILLALIFVSGVVYFLSIQMMKFGENLPMLKRKFLMILGQLQNWVYHTFGITQHKQTVYMNDAVSSSEALLGQAAGSALSVIINVILIPVYVFVILYYKELFLRFLHQVFYRDTTKVEEVLSQTKLAIQSYMVGLLLEAIAVAILNTVALWIIGIDYAILLGVLGAILNVLPYIGGLVAIALPVIIALVTKQGYTAPVEIVIAYTVIQFIDNHLLVPLLVSSRVQINAFFSILIVLLGGALWGISGMFLSIPFLAVLKIIFDRVPELSPWGKLLGDEVPTKRRNWGRRKKEPIGEKIVKKAEGKQ